MTYSGHLDNLVYWLREDLPRDEVDALRCIKRGAMPYGGRDPRDRFWIAHLIALDCVAASDSELSMTPKGEDALDFHEAMT